MGKITSTLTQSEIDFIGNQKLFFISSCSNEEVNLSPKGYDSIKVLDNNKLVMIDYPGSGNRTARDIENGGKITLLFTSFDAIPRNLNIFAKGKMINKNHTQWNEMISHFELESKQAIRQIFIFNVLKIENSCGMSVPCYEFKSHRNDLKQWAIDGNEDGTIGTYIKKHKTPIKLDIY
jgi:hypothetical protein